MLDYDGLTIGQASVMKMLYAGLNKGQWAMMATMCVAAAKHDLLETFLGELESSRADVFKTMHSWVGFLAADAHRFGPEMDEIAATFAEVGVTSKFHEGAAEMFRLMAKTPFAAETRETLDKSRTLEEALAEYMKHV